MRAPALGLRWQVALGLALPCAGVAALGLLDRSGWEIFGAAVAASLAWAFWLGRRLERPLLEAAQALRERSDATPTRSPELHALLSRLQATSAELVEATRDLQGVVDQQATDAQQVSTAIEELRRTAQSITTSTVAVDATARRTHSEMEAAQLIVAEVVERIGAARREAMDGAGAIGDLNREATRVTRTADTIKGIADKSDILALNAALEGAKAGEIGKGFSLVADEMRKLSESVGQSAQEIRQISEEIRESGVGAQQRAALGVRASDEAVAVAERAFDGFQKVLKLAKETAQVIEQIAVASREQLSANDVALESVQRIGSVLEKGAEATQRTQRVVVNLEKLVTALNAALTLPAQKDRGSVARSE